MSGNLARLGFTLVNLPDWHAEGACDGRTDLDWYGETRREIKAVKAVCADCPIKATCLQDAIKRREPWGVWGGLDPDERAEYAKQQGAAQPTISRHGERVRYVGSKTAPGCRCALCTRAHSDYEHARRLRKRSGWTRPAKPCTYCGDDFVPRSDRQRFCDPDCSGLYYIDKRAKRKAAQGCARCSGSLPAKRKRYCSDECARPKRQAPALDTAA